MDESGWEGWIAAASGMCSLSLGPSLCGQQGSSSAHICIHKMNDFRSSEQPGPMESGAHPSLFIIRSIWMSGDFDDCQPNCPHLLLKSWNDWSLPSQGIANPDIINIALFWNPSWVSIGRVCLCPLHWHSSLFIFFI